MTEPLTEAFVKIADLASALGVERVNELPGCWEHQIDGCWRIAVNGHDNSIACSDGTMVEPFTAYVTFNGLPAGVLTPSSGYLVAHDVANEDAFIAAIDAVLEDR